MGLWGKAAKALVIIVIVQIACRHCMPRTPRKSALLNNLNPAKNNPLSTPFSPARTDKTSKQTIGKTNQNARISKNPFPNESIFKKHNFLDNDFPLDTTSRDPFNLKTNFNNYQANRPKLNSLRNTQSSIINELKKERKMKRKLQSNAHLNNDINQPTKETLPTTFPSGSVNTLLDPQTFPDIQYPLNTMETWEPMYWNSFSLAPPMPFDGLETPRQKTNENVKNPSTRLTKTNARQFLKSYDKLKEENKRTSTDNSKRSNVGQSGLNFKKTATSEKVSEDFITSSLLENVPKNSSGTNITVELSTEEIPNSDTQDICLISDNPVNAGFTKSNRSESATKTSANRLKYAKITLLAEALAAIEDILNSDETNTPDSTKNICEILEENINTTCYPIRNETTSRSPVNYVEVINDTENNLQSSTNFSNSASTAFEELLEAKINDIPECVLQNNISSLLEETNIENLSNVTYMVNETTTDTLTEIAFTNKLSQIPLTQAGPGPTSIIIIPINNNAVGQPQSHMIDTTGNAPIIVYIPSTQSNDVPSQTMFCQKNISQTSLDKTMPSDEFNNGLSNMAPLLNDNPASTALVSELLNDISNSESLLPMCEPLPINSMCYNNESSQSSIKEKPFLNNSTHKSLADMMPFVNSTSNEKSIDDEHMDICDDMNTEKTLPQTLDSEHPIFDFPGSEATSLNHGPYNNVYENELPIIPREIVSNEVFINTSSDSQYALKENVTLDDRHSYPKHIPESGLLSDDMPKPFSHLPTVVPTEPFNVSLLPVDGSIQSLPLSENLGVLAKPADKTIPTLKPQSTNIPIELSLSSDSPTTNPFDRRIIIDVKLLPIEGSGGDHDNTITGQNTLPLTPDISISQLRSDKLLSERRDHIDSTIYNEPPKNLIARDNFQEERYETLPSTPYSETKYNLASSYEVDGSKPHLVNNLVTPIANMDPSHRNIEHTTNDMKDLPLRMGILLPEFSELLEDEPISYNVPKIEYSDETTNTDISNGLPIQMLDYLPLSRSTNEFDTTLFPVKVRKTEDMSNDTPKILNRPVVVPEDELILDVIKPYIKIDEITKESVTPVAESVAVKDEIEYMDGKLTDKKLLSPLRSENSLSETIGPSFVDHSSIDVNSDIPVNLPLPTDMSSLTSKLLVTKALLDNVLADINKTYNTGVLSTSTKSIPISFPLDDTNSVVEIREAPEPPLLECPLSQKPFFECNVNSSLHSEEVIPNMNDINGSKKVPSNTLLDIQPVTNIDETSNTDITANYLEKFTLSEGTCPFIPISEFPSSIEQIKNETVQTEITQNLTKSVEEIGNVSFPKIFNKSLNHTEDRIVIPTVDGNLSNSQELKLSNNSSSEAFKDSLSILDTTWKDDEAKNPILPSQFNDPISKTVDDIPAITVTKDLLESVLLDIFRNRLSLPLTEAHFEAAPSVSERIPYSPESTETTIRDTKQTSKLLGQINKMDAEDKTATIANTAYISETLENQPPVAQLNTDIKPTDLEKTTLNPPHIETENGIKLTITNNVGPKHDNIDSSNQNAPSSLSSEITITKELLESVLTDVLRKELLLQPVQSSPDISHLMFTNPPNDKGISIPNTATENYPKENEEATFNASLDDGPANLADSVTHFKTSTDQSNTQTFDKIHNIDLPSVDYVNEPFMATKEIDSFNDKSIKESTPTKPPLPNILKDVSKQSFTSSVDELPSITESHTPDDVTSSISLEQVDENFTNIQTTDCLDSPIDEENIEMLHIDKHKSTASQTNDKPLPIDEIMISIPNDDVLPPKSAFELRITKALLENVLMDIFTKGLLVPAERKLQMHSNDDITKERYTQLLETSSSTSQIDHSKDNLTILPMEDHDKTPNITNLDIPTDHSDIQTFFKEDGNNDRPLENGNVELSSIEDMKSDPIKGISPSIETRKYSPSKLTITKALLENVLTDIFAKGLSLPKEKFSSVTSPKVLDKTLYYTEIPITDMEKMEEAPLDISLVEHTNNDSTLTENSEKTVSVPVDKAVLYIPSINNPTKHSTEVNDMDQNHDNNLVVEEDNDDLSPLKEGISEPKTVPIASRSALDKTFYTVDINLPNLREETRPEQVDEIFKNFTEHLNPSGEDDDSILELVSDEITQDKHELDAVSEESYEEEILETNSEDLSNDAEEVTSLENRSDELLKEDILDVIKDVSGPPAKRVLYSKLPSTKALLEKVLFDITDGGILG